MPLRPTPCTPAALLVQGSADRATAALVVLVIHQIGPGLPHDGTIHNILGVGQTEADQFGGGHRDQLSITAVPERITLVAEILDAVAGHGRVWNHLCRAIGAVLNSSNLQLGMMTIKPVIRQASWRFQDQRQRVACVAEFDA